MLLKIGASLHEKSALLPKNCSKALKLHIKVLKKGTVRGRKCSKALLENALLHLKDTEACSKGTEISSKITFQLSSPPIHCRADQRRLRQTLYFYHGR